jgi:hypothetical protein
MSRIARAFVILITLNGSLSLINGVLLMGVAQQRAELTAEIAWQRDRAVLQGACGTLSDGRRWAAYGTRCEQNGVAWGSTRRLPPGATSRFRPCGPNCIEGEISIPSIPPGGSVHIPLIPLPRPAPRPDEPQT